VVKDEFVIPAYFIKHNSSTTWQRCKPRALMCWARTVAPWCKTFAGKSARATQSLRPHHQAENEVPQPHDFVAWGFTKTNPCCIRVSW
jgi:hypothetical protein